MDPDSVDLALLQPIPISLANSAGFLLNRAAKIIHDINEQALAPLKLSPRDVGMLLMIASEGPLSQQAIGKKHSIDRTTVVQIIDSLESRDLVTRVTNQSDRRSNSLYITPRGKKTLSQAMKLLNKQQELFLQPISEDEWRQLRISLARLIEHHLGPTK